MEMKISPNKIALALLMSAAVACSKDDEKKISKEELLTANSSKSWNVTYATFDKDEPDESCKSVNVSTADNAWIFKSKGVFEFNNGTLTEVPECPECQCSDFANLTGTWKLFSNEDSLSVVATGRIEDNGDITDFADIEILRYKLKSLTATEMVFGGTTEYMTFKPK